MAKLFSNLYRQIPVNQSEGKNTHAQGLVPYTSQRTVVHYTLTRTTMQSSQQLAGMGALGEEHPPKEKEHAERSYEDLGEF